MLGEAVGIEKGRNRCSDAAVLSQTGVWARRSLSARAPGWTYPWCGDDSMLLIESHALGGPGVRWGFGSHPLRAEDPGPMPIGSATGKSAAGTHHIQRDLEMLGYGSVAGRLP